MEAPGVREAVVPDPAVVIEIDVPEEAGDVELACVLNREFLDSGSGTVLYHREINDKVVGHVVYIVLGFILHDFYFYRKIFCSQYKRFMGHIAHLRNNRYYKIS